MKHFVRSPVMEFWNLGPYFDDRIVVGRGGSRDRVRSTLIKRLHPNFKLRDAGKDGGISCNSQLARIASRVMLTFPNWSREDDICSPAPYSRSASRLVVVHRTSTSVSGTCRMQALSCCVLDGCYGRVRLLETWCSEGFIAVLQWDEG